MSKKQYFYQKLRGSFAKLGLSVTFDRPVRNPMKLMALKSAELGVRTVLDVGANLGQFATELRGAGYVGTIVSFEPLSAVHPSLRRSAENDTGWLVAPRMALGDTPGRTKINVSRNRDSSSLLPVAQRSVDAAPETSYVSVDDVEVWRLDDVVDAAWPTPFALKLDTQGFELHVLRGAPRTLQNTVLLITELSLAPLYAGGAAMVDVFQFLERHGFRCISIVEGFADPRRHEVLQVDGIFVRDM
jgi:FkbM family methyltransferase